jgi:hypothetical protein
MTTISEISSPRSQRFVHLGFARSVVGTWLLGRAEVELDRHGRDHRSTRGWWLGRGDGSEAGAPPTSSVVVVRLDVDGDEVEVEEVELKAARGCVVAGLTTFSQIGAGQSTGSSPHRRLQCTMPTPRRVRRSTMHPRLLTAGNPY